MSFSFSSLVRLLVLLAVASTMFAVGISRLEPSRVQRRVKSPATHWNVDDYLLEGRGARSRWLDLRTGDLSTIDLEDGDLLEAASCSPWVDDQGRRQVVGRWMNRSLSGPNAIYNDFGLARYAFPGGQRLDQVPMDVLPVGSPCWFPGTRARVLFAATDGRLYHYDFEPEGRAGLFQNAEQRPRPLTWRCARPGEGEVYMSSLSWPEDPRMGGRLLVSLRRQSTQPDGKRTFTRGRLWWLKLNPAGTEVVEAGPLVDPERGEADSHRLDEREASIGSLPDGRLALAYLAKPAGDVGDWQLRLTPIRFEGDKPIPKARTTDARILTGACQHARPAFSSDGRWIGMVVGPIFSRGQFTRIPTDEGRVVDNAL